MPMLPPQPVSLTCPNCGTAFQTPVYQLIDVGQEPDLKQALLAGRINLAVCPNCGTGGMLAAPLVYHDPAKQFFFTLMPQEIKATPQEQEQFIGALTQFVLRDLPAETPKGYLLTPHRFITLTSMLDAILEGEGIPKEALVAQRKRSELLGRLLQAPNEQAFKQLVEANRETIDYEFFLTLSAYIESAQQEQDQETVGHFTALRDRLAAMTGFDAETPDEEAEPELDEIVEALVQAQEEQLPEVIAEYRPALDYSFYEALGERIDAATTAGDTALASQLSARRDLIRTTTEQMDRDAQELFEGATQVLEEVLDAEDLRAALSEHREKLSEAFLLVVAANVQQAERTGNQALVERLHEIERLAVEVVQEALSPAERLISQLLSAETPQDATKLLRQNASMITTDFVKRLNELAADSDTSGRKEIGDRLRQLGRESASMLF